MSAKFNLLLGSLITLSPWVLSQSLTNTGTVDELVRQGQIQYQQAQDKIVEAAKERAQGPVSTTEAPVFKDLSQPVPIPATRVDRLYYVGYFDDGDHPEANIYYQGVVAGFSVGNTLPKGFRLIRITPASIQIKNRQGVVQTLSMRSVASIKGHAKPTVQPPQSQPFGAVPFYQGGRS